MKCPVPAAPGKFDISQMILSDMRSRITSSLLGKGLGGGVFPLAALILLGQPSSMAAKISG